MVKLNRRLNLLILVVVFTATSWLCFQPLAKLGTDRTYLEPLTTSHLLTAEELGSFLTLWAKIKNGSFKKYFKQISLHNTDDYPRVVVKWLNLNNWSAERFFYDEQHIRDLLRCVELKKSLNANIEASTKTKVNLADLVSSQKQGMESCVFDKDELELIKINRNQIVAIFAE